MKLIGFISATGLSLLLGIAIPAYGWQDQQEQKQDKKDKPAQQEEKHSKDAKPAKQDAHKAQQDKQPAQKQEKQAQVEEKKAEPSRPAQKDEHKAQQDKQPAQKQEKQAQVEEKKAEPSRPAQKDEHQAQQDKQHAQQQSGREPIQRTQEQQRVQQSAWQQHRSANWQSDHRSWTQRGGYHGYRIPDDRFRGYFGPQHGFRIYGLPFMVESGYPRFQYEGYWFSLVDPWPEYWANDWYDTDEVYVTYVDNGYYLFNRRYPTVAIAINISE